MRISKIVAVLLVLLLLLAGCGSPQQSANTADTKSVPVSDGGDINQQPSQNPTPEHPQTTNKTSGGLKVHFLDVGQADSILIQLPNGQSMLVDAVNNADGPSVISYLKQQGIKKIDYLVATAPAT